VAEAPPSVAVDVSQRGDDGGIVLRQEAAKIEEQAVPRDPTDQRYDTGEACRFEGIR